MVQKVALIDNRLAYILEKPKKRTDKCIILAHGITGNKDEDHKIFVKLSKALVREGFAVLRFDFTGEGESRGKRPGISLLTLWNQVGDLLAAIHFAMGKYRSIGLVGLSFGACTVLHTRHPAVRCRALWSGFSYPYSLFPLNFLLDWWAGRRCAPVLVVTGERDETVPPLSQKMMYSVLPSPKKLVVVPGGDHTFRSKDYGAIRPTVEWLKNWL